MDSSPDGVGAQAAGIDGAGAGDDRTQPQYTLRVVPARQVMCIVATDNEKDLSIGVVSAYLSQCIDGVGRPGAIQFGARSLEVVDALQGEFDHCPAVSAGSDVIAVVFVRGSSSRDEEDPVEVHLLARKTGEK